MEKPLKILIVEDDQTTAIILQETLSKKLACTDVVLVQDGQAAWDRLTADHFDLIISDWNMPHKAGDELLYEVRHNEKTQHIPFFMLTSRSSQYSVITASKFGANDYIVKPFKADILVKKIQTLLSNSSCTQTSGREDGVTTTHNLESSRSQNLIDDIVQRFQRGNIPIPTVPQVSCKLVEVLHNEATTLTEICNVIASDPGISAKLLRISNSSYYRGLEECRTLEQAITRLGLEKVKHYTLTLVNRALFKPAGPLFEDLLEELWEHSLATGICASIVATQLALPHPEVLFHFGLLHDIGKLLVLQILTEIAQSREHIDENSIRETLDALHEEFGAALLARWNFQQEFQYIVRYHHDLSKVDAIPQDLLIVHFSNLLVHALEQASETEVSTQLMDVESAKLLHFDNDRIEALVSEVQTRVKDIKATLGG